MKNILKRSCLIASIVILAASCAEESTENDTNALFDRVLESWVRYNYPDRIDSKTESGAYVLEFEEGIGSTPYDSEYVFVRYVKTDLEGNILLTNDKDLNQQIRTYSKADYYGPGIWRLTQGYISTGIEEVLSTMQRGGKSKVALSIESSALSYSVYSAFPNTTEEDNCLFYLMVDTIVNDIQEYESRTMEKYRDEHYPGLDTTMEGFYFKKLIKNQEDLDEDGETDTIADGTTVYLRYIARRLYDGGVFDTNIKDTAKKYGIYNESNEYSTLTATFYKDESEFLSSNTSTIEGFNRIVCRLYFNECGVGFFWSDMGYGESGSDTQVPEYAPLEFTIWVYEDDD